MTDPLTINKMMPIPVPGSDFNVWTPPFNDVFGITDNSFGGTATVALTNVPVVLSTAQYQCAFLNFTGALSANVAVTLPAVGSFYTVINDTTNSSAFTVTLLTTVAGSRQIGVPPSVTDIMTDGSNVRFRSLPYIGSYWNYTGSSTPAWVTACTVPPWLYCNGTAFSSTVYPSLTNILGSSQTPDLRGRTVSFLNDGTARLTVVDGNTRFASGGGQTVTLSQANLPAVNFSISDPGHTHSIAFSNAGAVSGGNPGGASFAVNGPTAATITVVSAVTNITVASGGSGTPIALLPPRRGSGHNPDPCRVMDKNRTIKNALRIAKRYADGGDVDEQPTLLDQARHDYPVLKNYDIGYKSNVGGGSGYMESYPPGEEGTSDFPRPKEFPINQFGVENYRADSKPSDLAADVTSHHLINVDPTIQKTYRDFTQSLEPWQHDILKQQYQYAVQNEGERRPYQSWLNNSGLPGYFRGYTFQQWPDEFNKQAYTPKQKQLLDGAMRYLQSGNEGFADGGEVNLETGLPDPDPQPAFDEFDLQRQQAEALPDRPETVMEPDLQTSQIAHGPDVHDPNKYVVDELGRVVEREKYAAGSDEAVQFTPRPGMLPLTKTPEGRYEPAMPKIADIAGNMGAGWSVPVSGAEHILGAGLAMPKKAAIPPKAGEVGRSWFDLNPQEVKAAQPVSESKGTSPGAVMTGFADGKDRYVKVAKSLDHAKNEVLASKLYELAGVPVAKNELTQVNGKPAVASHIVPGQQLSDFGPWNYPNIKGLEEHMPADAWLANGDVIGAGTENPKGNIMVHGDRATRIDFGGALRYAGLGGLKPDKLFGPKVGNFLEGLQSENLNPTAAEAFHGHQISPDNVTAQRIAAVTDDQIKSLVYQYGPTDMAAKEKLSNTLIARRDDLAAHYGVGKSLEQQMAEILPKKDNVVDLQGEPYTEPKPDFGHTVPQDDFKESMDALASLAKTAEYKPMQLNKQHSPEQYITALSGQTYGSALTKKAVTTKQGNKILENFQNMDQDKLAQALHGLPPEKMANVATWAKPGTIKKIWEQQKKATTPLSEVFGVEPQSIADEIIQKTKDPVQMAEVLYAVAKKNPELADEVFKLLPSAESGDINNHMNYLIGKHGDPWAEPKFKSAKDYGADEDAEYWNSVDKGIKNEWETAQGGSDFIKKIDKVWTSKFDKYFKTQDWMTYIPKEYTAGKHTKIETTPLQFLNKTPKELREMGMRPDIPIYKGGANYPVGSYPARMPDPLEKYSEKAWFAGALHHTGSQYGGHDYVNPYVYGGKDLKVGRINFKDAHNGNASYIEGDMDGLIDAAHNHGFDMVIIEDISDLGSYKSGLHTQFAFLNTKGLRAPHAAFDPDKLKLNRPNPLWGLVGGGLFSYGMLKGQEGNEQKFARGGVVASHKIGRDAFLYMTPKQPKDSFAQCGTCRDFTGTGCMILGQTRITKGMSCGLYVRGQPRLNMKGREQSLVSPEQAGLVNFQVRCENCKYGGPTCKLYEALNEELPDKFDLETKIDPKACCNGFTRDE